MGITQQPPLSTNKETDRFKMKVVILFFCMMAIYCTSEAKHYLIKTAEKDGDYKMKKKLDNDGDYKMMLPEDGDYKMKMKMKMQDGDYKMKMKMQDGDYGMKMKMKLNDGDYKMKMKLGHDGDYDY